MAATNIRELTFEHVLETILKPAGVKFGGFPEEIFIDLTEKEKEDWLCTICYRVVNDCRQCANHHKFCMTCIFAWSLTYGENSQLCPVCRNPQDSYEVCKEASEKLENRLVKCDETGCDFRAPLRIYLLHSHGRAKYSNSGVDLESLRPPRIGGRNFFLLNSSGPNRDRMGGLRGQLSQGRLMIHQMMMLLHLEMQLRQQAIQSSARVEIRRQQIDEVLALNEQLTEVGTILSLLLDTPLSEVRGQRIGETGNVPPLDAQTRPSQAATSARRNLTPPSAAATASQGWQGSSSLFLGIGRGAALRNSNAAGIASVDSGLGSSDRFESLLTSRSRSSRPDSPAVPMQRGLFPDFDTDDSNNDDNNEEEDSESFIPLWRRSLNNSSGVTAAPAFRTNARSDTNTGSNSLLQRSRLGGAGGDSAVMQSSTSRILANRNQQYAPTLNLFDSSNLLESSNAARSGADDQVSIVTLGASPAASFRPPPVADVTPIRRPGTITTSSTTSGATITSVPPLLNLQQQVAALSSGNTNTAPTRAQQPTSSTAAVGAPNRVNNNTSTPGNRQDISTQLQPTQMAGTAGQQRSSGQGTSSQTPRRSIVPPMPISSETAAAAASREDAGTFSVTSTAIQVKNHNTSEGQRNSSQLAAASSGPLPNSSYRGLSMALRERHMPDAAPLTQQASRESVARVSNASNSGRNMSNVNASERHTAATSEAVNTSLARGQQPTGNILVATVGQGSGSVTLVPSSHAESQAGSIPPTKDRSLLRPAAAANRSQAATQTRSRLPPAPPPPASSARGTAQPTTSRMSGTLLPRLNTTVEQSANPSNVAGVPTRRSQAVLSDESHRLRMTSSTTATTVAGSTTGRSSAVTGAAQRIPSANEVPRSRRRSEIMQDILNASRR